MKGRSFFLAPTPTSALHGMWDLSSPTHGSNLRPQEWKGRVLTTGPPGKSHKAGPEHILPTSPRDSRVLQTALGTQRPRAFPVSTFF